MAIFTASTTARTTLFAVREAGVPELMAIQHRWAVNYAVLLLVRGCRTAWCHGMSDRAQP
jgi:hypothetical protein